MTSNLPTVETFLRDFQKHFCEEIAKQDGKEKFLVDAWQKPAGEMLQGNGVSCVIANGHVFEKGGANFSLVSGEKLPAAATANRPELSGSKFSAVGLSIVMHPKNPYAPTSHANIRYFEATTPEGVTHWWFGGGFDLTPYYAFEEDCIDWHKHAKAACDPFGKEVYPKFKTWADRYFYLKHREESRGIGGIFYDDLNGWPFESCFEFMQHVIKQYLEAYASLVERRKNTPYTERERDFQLFRRGRYVEFNLLYDRGTIFGLQSGGRTESILMSLPPIVTWEYQRPIEAGSPEAKLTEYFLKPKEWV